MLLLHERESGIQDAIEFNYIDCTVDVSNNKIDSVAVHLWNDLLEPNTQRWFYIYCYNVKNEKDFQMVKEHILKILNHLMVLDYIRTSDFPINGINGEFYDNWWTI